MIEDILSIARFIKYKVKYPNSRISYGATIDNQCQINGVINVSRNTLIRSSNLSNNVIIEKECRITESNIKNSVRIFNNCSLWNTSIDCYSYIAPNAVIGKTTIGRFCSIGPRLQCTVGRHPTNWPSTSPIFYSTLNQCGISFSDKEYFNEYKGIKVGNDVWIGSCVFIGDGVSIGNGSIIAAGAVVVKDVPDYSIVGGVPAKLIRYRFSEEVRGKLSSIKWWDWPELKLKKAQPYFCQENVEQFIRWADNN